MSSVQSVQNKQEVFPIKVSVNKKYQKVVDFYTKQHSLSRLINVLLDEVDRDKSFKFRILKKLDNLDI